MKIAWILRGLAGSGKSSLAFQLAPEEYICSTDQQFIENGKYVFRPSKLEEAHQKNFEKFEDLCKAGAHVVVCDNTNMQRRHYGIYEIAAKHYGYNVNIVTVGQPADKEHQEECAKRNVHGLTLTAIQRMASKWEP